MRVRTPPRSPAARARAATAAVAGLLLLGGCAGILGTSEPEPSRSEAPSATPEPVEQPVAPLTGVPVEAPIDAPALSAKIDNHPDARPQYGLERADIVYEELVEGGLTRYVGVWHSDVPDGIGPVRSIRPMDPAIVAPFGGLVAYSGGQQRFLDAIEDTGLENVVHGGAYDGFFSRTSERIAPHDVILEARRVVDEADRRDAPQPAFAYAEDGATPSAEAGAPASALALAFSPGEARQWACDAGSGRWLRSQQGVPDASASGERLSAANVVVLRVDVVDDGGVPETVLAGASGEGIVASGCSSIPVSWSKADRDSPVELRDAAGATVALAPGGTWVELVPTTGSAAAS